MAELKKQAKHIVKELTTLDAYIATLYLLEVQAGLIRGYDVDNDWRKDYLILVDYTQAYDTWYSEWETSVIYDWAVVNTSVDTYEGEEVDVSDNISDQEISSEDSYADYESFDMSEGEEDDLAAEEDTDEEVASVDEEGMEDALDHEGEDMSAAVATTVATVAINS